MSRLKLFRKKAALKHSTPPPMQEKRPAPPAAVKFAQGTKTESTFRGSMKPPLRQALRCSPPNTSTDDVQQRLDQLVTVLDEMISGPAANGSGASRQDPAHRSEIPAVNRSEAAGRYVQAAAKDLDLDDAAWLDRLAKAGSPEERLRILNEDLLPVPHPVGDETKNFANVARTRRPANHHASGAQAVPTNT